MTDTLNMEGYLLKIETMTPLTTIFTCYSSKFGFNKNFLRRIETLLNNQKSCIINMGITTNCFKLKKGTRKRSISTYWFFQAVFCVIK